MSYLKFKKILTAVAILWLSLNISPVVSADIGGETLSKNISGAATVADLSPEIDFGEEGDVILKVFLRDILLTDGLFAIMRDSQVFLPLAELSVLLDFPILVDPVAGTASGWFLEPANTFVLNIGNGTVEVKEQQFSINDAAVFSDDIDLFVSSTALSEWLPLFFDVSLSAQILKVRSTEKLPKELARERSEQKALKDVTFAATNEYDIPDYRLLDWPELSVNLGGFYAPESNSTLFDYRLRAVGDFALLNGRVGISGREDEITGATVTLGRSDPGGMFGPLRVADFELGDTSQFLPGMIGSSSSGLGLRFGNTRLADRRDLDTIDLQGEQQAGYEVEVYVNDRLRDVDRNSDNNFYDFQDVPLQLGANEIRLEFYGPQGQRFTETRRAFVGGGRGRKGSFDYEFALVEPGQRVFDLFEDSLEADTASDAGDELQDFNLSSAVSLSYGLTSRTSLGLTVASLAASAEAENKTGRDNFFYTNARVTTELAGVLLSSDLTIDPNSNAAGALSARTTIGNYDLGATQRLFQKEFRNTADIGSEDTDNLTRLATSGNLSRQFFAVPGGRFSYGANASYQQNQSGDEMASLGTQLDYHTSLLGLSWSHDNSFNLANSSQSINGRLAARLNTGDRSKWSLSSNWNYSDSGDQLFKSGSLRLVRPLGDQGNISLSAIRDLEVESTAYSATWNRQYRPFTLNTSVAGTSSENVSMRVGLEFTAKRYPNRLLPLISSTSSGGSLAVVVFGDENQNGKHDESEPVLEGVRLTRNGLLSNAATDSKGVALLSGLSINSSVDIGILESDIKEPGYKFNGIKKGVLVRAGRIPVIPVPLQPATDIEGTVVIAGTADATPAPNVRMLLTPIEGGEPLEVRTEYDGYYYLAHVPLGVYDFGPDPVQLESAGLVAESGTRRLDLRNLIDFPPPEDFDLTRLADQEADQEPLLRAAQPVSSESPAKVDDTETGTEYNSETDNGTTSEDYCPEVILIETAEPVNQPAQSSKIQNDLESRRQKLGC